MVSGLAVPGLRVTGLMVSGMAVPGLAARQKGMAQVSMQGKAIMMKQKGMVMKVRMQEKGITGMPGTMEGLKSMPCVMQGKITSGLPVIMVTAMPVPTRITGCRPLLHI
jgi:hypothetical protein